jgi:hypothetical protein
MSQSSIMTNKASKRYSSQEVIMSHDVNQDSIQNFNLQDSSFQVPKYSALQKVNRRNNLNYVYGRIPSKKLSNSKSKRSPQN